jgi:probable phosphoglycerate mutase
MTLLYLVRHGDTYFEADSRVKGQLDVPLAPSGRRQAAAVLEALATVRADAVYCSTLRRTRAGAELLAAATGARLAPTALLDERGWGTWQGLTSAAIAREREAGRAGSDDFAPGGEPFAAFSERVDAFLALVAVRHSGGTVIVVTHGGVLKNAVLPALGRSVRDRGAFTADTGSISLLAHEGRCWRPLFLNRIPGHEGFGA